MPNTVILKGWKEFENKLNSLPKQLEKEVDFAVEDAAGLWEQKAKQDAPVDQGRLKQQISRKRVAAMNWEVVSPAEHSAWLEWGTKSKVRVPSDIAQYAAQFRGGGSGGGNAKTMIYAWMNRVGIPPEAQWAVFISIIVNGITPHPYFFIQRPFVQAQLDSDIKQILNTEH
jgi:HK97 gp10 family phage protein